MGGRRETIETRFARAPYPGLPIAYCPSPSEASMNDTGPNVGQPPPTVDISGVGEVAGAEYRPDRRP